MRSIILSAFACAVTLLIANSDAQAQYIQKTRVIYEVQVEYTHFVHGSFWETFLETTDYQEAENMYYFLAWTQYIGRLNDYAPFPRSPNYEDDELWASDVRMIVRYESYFEFNPQFDSSDRDGNQTGSNGSKQILDR